MVKNPPDLPAPSIRRRFVDRRRHGAAQLRRRRRGGQTQRHQQLAADGAIGLGGVPWDLWATTKRDGNTENSLGKMMKNGDFPWENDDKMEISWWKNGDFMEQSGRQDENL